MKECAVHFLGNELVVADEMDYVDSLSERATATGYHPSKNQCTDVPRLKAHDMMGAPFHPDTSGLARYPMTVLSRRENK